MALRFRGLDAPVEVRYWKGGSAPVPDPNLQVAAQTGATRTNTVGPTGTSIWSTGAPQLTGYDQNGKPIYSPTGTQTTTLSPTEQRQFDISNQIAETMLGGAQGKIAGPGGIADSTFSYDQATPAAAQAAYQRQVNLLQPQFKMADQQFEQKMTNMGLPVGSDAYNEALRQHEQDKNFALTDAAAGAEQEGTQLALSQRQEQYNELASALGGQELMPTNAFAPGGSGAVDVSGAYNAANQARLANYNAGVETQNANTGAAAGIGSAAIIAAVAF